MSVSEEQAYWTRHSGQAAAFIFYDETEYDLILSLLGQRDLQGNQLLELGSGLGVWTANLAQLGVRVFHLDLAPSIVQKASIAARPCETFGITADMHHLPSVGEAFDCAFGSMILHHAQDHMRLGEEVARVLKTGGRAVFHENSARNPLLMLARATLVGRFGITKRSSPGEHPLRDDEIEALGTSFRSCEIHVGRMMFAELSVMYLLRREGGALFALARRLDRRLHRSCSCLRRLSYFQIIVFRK